MVGCEFILSDKQSASQQCTWNVSPPPPYHSGLLHLLVKRQLIYNHQNVIKLGCKRVPRAWNFMPQENQPCQLSPASYAKN